MPGSPLPPIRSSTSIRLSGRVREATERLSTPKTITTSLIGRRTIKSNSPDSIYTNNNNKSQLNNYKKTNNIIIRDSSSSSSINHKNDVGDSKNTDLGHSPRKLNNSFGRS